MKIFEKENKQFKEKESTSKINVHQPKWKKKTFLKRKQLKEIEAASKRVHPPKEKTFPNEKSKEASEDV